MDVIFPTQSSTYLGKNVLKQNLCFPVDPVGGVNVTSAVQLPIILLLSPEVKRWRSSVGPCVCFIEGLKRYFKLMFWQFYNIALVHDIKRKSKLLKKSLNDIYRTFTHHGIMLGNCLLIIDTILTLKDVRYNMFYS